LNATLTLLTELVMSGMKGMGFKDLFEVKLFHYFCSVNTHLICGPVIGKSEL